MSEKTEYELIIDISTTVKHLLEYTTEPNKKKIIEMLNSDVVKLFDLLMLKDTPSTALQDAVKETCGAIHLFAKEGHAVVSIEVNDKWVELMKEPLDSPFSRIIEPLGIQRKIESA